MPPGVANPDASRILVVTTSFPTHVDDAAGHFVQSELETLPQGELHVVAPAPAGHLAGLEVRQIGGREVQVHWLHAGSAFGWPGMAARLRQAPWRAHDVLRFLAAARVLCGRLEPRHVVAHWALPSAWPLAPRTPSLQVVSHGGDVRLLLALPAPLRQAAVQAVVARASSWRFVSSALREQLEGGLTAELRRRLDRVACVGAPRVSLRVDENQARALRESIDTRLLVSVGRLVKTKRVDRIVQHLADSGEPGTLVVVGDGPERQALEALASRTRLPVRFVGQTPRPEALAWIRAADCMYFASEAEGLSTVLREAEALGTPVITL